MIDIAVFKRLRKEKDLSQPALAKLAGVSQQLITEIEQGRTKTTKAIYRIAAIFGTSAHLIDPEIPSLEGRVAQLIEDLKTIDELQADLILQNVEASIDLVKSRRSADRSGPARHTDHLHRSNKQPH